MECDAEDVENIEVDYYFTTMFASALPTNVYFPSFISLLFFVLLPFFFPLFRFTSFSPVFFYTVSRDAIRKKIFNSLFYLYVKLKSRNRSIKPDGEAVREAERCFDINRASFNLALNALVSILFEYHVFSWRTKEEDCRERDSPGCDLSIEKNWTG